jgi:hypothetical protein
MAEQILSLKIILDRTNPAIWRKRKPSTPNVMSGFGQSPCPEVLVDFPQG